ncbi:MAG TPA: ABC transporter permease [Candidatus Acidoferrales bacterium]|nr:ABC transporter permease [Candidatus Acidoferrales bacterium]
MNQRWQFVARSRLGRAGLALSLLLVLTAIAGPAFAPYDPAAQSLPHRLEPPSRRHWLGTDPLGRDVLSRVLYGARVSVTVGVTVVLGAGLVGLLVGAVAGFLGGWVDRLINVIFINAFLAFPGILLAIAFAAFLGPGLGNVILALVITGWAGYARLARATALKVTQLDYVAAARVVGASGWRILVRHVLPNILQPVLVQAMIGLASAILAESTLSFLGLGVLAPTPSWGAMLNDARNHLFDAPFLVISPALGVIWAVMAFNLLGDALRDWLDPRTRSSLIAIDLAR